MGQKLQYRKPYLNLFKTLLANEENETKKVIPAILRHVLQEFQDVIYMMKFHQVFLQHKRFIFPHKFSYRMSLKEYE
jgi:hypothetical protein